MKNVNFFIGETKIFNAWYSVNKIKKPKNKLGFSMIKSFFFFFLENSPW